MELLKIIKENGSIVRIAATAALAIIAVRSFVNGKRLRGLLAAGGAVAVGATASTLEPTDLEVVSEEGEQPIDVTTTERVTESTIEAGAMQCSICSGPIVPGEARRPNDVDEIVHEACLE